MDVFKKTDKLSVLLNYTSMIKLKTNPKLLDPGKLIVMKSKSLSKSLIPKKLLKNLI